MTRWMLFDYGKVICLPQPASDLDAMAHLAGLSRPEFDERYWQYRDAYDRGQPAPEYWGNVLGRPLSADDPLVAGLDDVDVASWSHLDPEMLRYLDELVDSGARLALLSNAPEALAVSIDAADWAKPFDQLFYSCRFGLAKPDAALYREVLRRLDAAPDEVTFTDDRAENIEAAAALGLRTVHHVR